MIHFLHRIILILFCCMASFTVAFSAAETPDKSEVEALVRQLGDERFSVREHAEQKLKEIGEPVKKPLQAFRNDPNPEIRARVQGVLDYLVSLRRELKWIDPKNAGKGKYRSIFGGRAVKLTFRNLTKKPVRIFWIETDGSWLAWRGVLKAGAIAVCARSHREHFWLITDLEKKPLGMYKINMDDPILAVRDLDWKK